MGQMANQLSPEDVDKLREAKRIQQQLQNMGMGHMVEALPTEKNTSDNTSKDVSEEVEDVAEETPSVPVKKTKATPKKAKQTPKKEIKPPLVSDTVNEVVKQYDNFIEIDGLPSQGVLYRDTLMGQALKVEDLLQIQTLDETNVTQRFTEIFGRRLRGIDPLEILLVDELYISLWLRATSFPNYGFPDDGLLRARSSIWNQMERVAS